MTRRGFILEEHIDALTHDDPRTDGFVGPLELKEDSKRRVVPTPVELNFYVKSQPYRCAA